MSRECGHSGRIDVCYVDCVGSCSEMTAARIEPRILQRAPPVQSFGRGNSLPVGEKKSKQRRKAHGCNSEPRKLLAISDDQLRWVKHEQDSLF